MNNSSKEIENNPCFDPEDEFNRCFDPEDNYATMLYRTGQIDLDLDLNLEDIDLSDLDI